MEEMIFLVQGSAAEPYEVRFVYRGDGNLSAYCTCPAGQNGIYCKHRFQILDGKKTKITSGNEDEVLTVVAWLSGSDIEAAMHEVRGAEAAAARAKKDVQAAKKALARAMLD